MTRARTYQSLQVPSTMTRGGGGLLQQARLQQPKQWKQPSLNAMNVWQIINNRFYGFRLPSITHLVEVPNYFFFNLHWFCPIWKLENAFLPCLFFPPSLWQPFIEPVCQTQMKSETKRPIFSLLPLVLSQKGMPQHWQKAPAKSQKLLFTEGVPSSWGRRTIGLLNQKSITHSEKGKQPV